MNRSFRASEGPTVRSQRQQKMRGDAVKREKEDDLALFLEMHNREDDLLLHGSEEFDAPLGSREGASPIFNIPSSAPTRRTGTDDFLNYENDKNDYDWLLTPPGTPLFPSLEMETQRTVTSQIGTPKARPASLQPKLANPQPQPAWTLLASKQTTSTPGVNTSILVVCRPSSSGGPGSRPSTPSGHPTLTSTSKPTHTNVAKSTSLSKSTTMTTAKSMPSASKSSSTTLSTKPSRASTPTSRSTLPSTKPTVPPISSIPSSGTTATSSTLTSRSILPASKPPSRSATPTRRVPTSTNSSVPPVKSTSSSDKPSFRSATPTRRPATLSTSAYSSAPPVRSVSSSDKPPLRSATPTCRSATLLTSTNSCAPPVKPASSSDKPPTRSATPTRKPASLSTSTNSSAPPVKSASSTVTRSWNHSEMPGFSLDATARGRPVAPSARSSSVERVCNGKIRRQSCSPSRGRAPNGIKSNIGGSVPAVSRIHAKANECISPVLIGTKMVERVINMRRLVPPKHDNKQSTHSNLSGKSLSPDSSGFGRSFSKKSLDMAVRHMDIRKSVQGNMRPLMTKNIPALSMYSVRPGPTRSKTMSVSDSPLATSSNASSEVSVNNNGFCVDGSELEDDINSEKGARSPANIRGR